MFINEILGGETGRVVRGRRALDEEVGVGGVGEDVGA